jgi:hypothetical protein
MASSNLFTPATQATVSITSANTTANVALGATKGTFNQVRIKNIDATNIAYINFGNSSVAATLPSGATAGSIPIGAGETAGFTVPSSTTHVAVICSAGTPIVYITPGNGT